MRLLQLQYFVETAKEQNLTRVAARLHIAQPSLSQTLKRLENEMGTPLFERRGKRLKLNEAGEVLLQIAEPMIATLEALPYTLQEAMDEASQTVSLNVLVASQVTTQMMISYKEQHPKCNFKTSRRVDSFDWDLCISDLSGKYAVSSSLHSPLGRDWN